MTTHLEKQETVTTPPQVASFPPRGSTPRRILVASVLSVLAGVVATVVYLAIQGSEAASISPPAEPSVQAPIANWSFPEWAPTVAVDPPARPYRLPETTPTATGAVETTSIEGWYYPEMRPVARPATELLTATEQIGPR